MDLNRPKRECDLIMKGGITSGVVYPNAIYALSEAYRFRNIGGASAGAIAAGATAAAEYGRQSGASGPKTGMHGIKAIPGQFATGGVLRFFQPASGLRRAFGVLTDVLAAKDAERRGGTRFNRRRMTFILARRYYPLWAIPLALGLVAGLGWFLWEQRFGWALIAFACLMGMVGGTVYLGLRRLIGDVTTQLPDKRYGLCTGKTEMDLGTGPALTSWLTELFNELAGLDSKGAPLTFRMLKEQKVDLAVMTTCLTLGRPYRLPLSTAAFWFDEAEFRQLFEDNVVEHLIGISKAIDPKPRQQDGKTYWRFPGDFADEKRPQTGLDLPVVVAVRMSLSFPLLMQAVPLYAVDFSIKQEPLPSGEPPLTLCWFSDGGISSNFPMHFFDSYLPTRPTFGVSLGRYNPAETCGDPEDVDEGGEKSGTAAASSAGPGTGSAATEVVDREVAEAQRRIRRPEKAGDGLLPEFAPFNGVPGFLFRILSSAKDWQDNMLSQLSGYRERVVTVNLTESEGGINLDMDKKRIEHLSRLGDLAGRNLVGDPSLSYPGFNFDEHRWRRFLVTQDRVRNLLETISISWSDGADTTKAFIERYASQPGRSYPGNRAADVLSVAGQFQELSELTKDWASNPPARELAVPKPNCVVRITPKE